MNEFQESQFAREVFEVAYLRAFNNSEPQDRHAATTAILMQALILSTPELSNEGRQRLFMECEE